MAEAVPEVLAEARRRDHVARDPVGLDARHAGPDPRDGRELRLEADVVGAPQLRRERAGGERARAVGAVAVEPCAPVARRRASSSRRAGRRDRRAAWRAFGPERIAVSKLSSSTPCACISVRSRQATSRSVRPTQVSAVSAWKAWSAARAARRTFSISASSFTARRPSTMPVVGTSSSPFEPSVCASENETRVGLEPDAAVEPLGEIPRQRAPGQLGLHARHLLGVEHVAEVGEEPGLACRVDEQRGVRRGEARSGTRRSRGS